MNEKDMLIKLRIPEATDPSEWEVIEEQISLTESLDKLGQRLLDIAKGVVNLVDRLYKGG